LLSADGENDSDVLSMVGASCALCLSDIPFAGPIGAVRVGYIEEKFVVNPTHTEMENSVLDLVYAGNETEVVMIEGAADELPEDLFCQALEFAQGYVTKLVQAQKELTERIGKPKREAPLLEVKDEMLDIAYSVAGDRIEGAIYKPSKVERGKAVDGLREEVTNAILEKYEDASEFAIDQAFDFMQKKAFRKSIFEKGIRADGRKIDELRHLSAEVDLMPRSHGSALFARGETQALGLCTLAPADEAQFIDAYTGGEEEKSFLLHYHFPPFSVGETGRMGGLNRREIGHGALAERSIKPALPDKDDFPYAIRVTSEVMESNGSTSMASVCAGTMALLDAGVPLKRPVAGISVGLVTEMDDSGNITDYKRLLDIIGSEDFFGDMDFKLCGTEQGVTGFQLDLKLTGLPITILNEAIQQATEARTKVLAVMAEGIKGPAEISPHAPRIESIKINPEKIGNVIGPGGKIIKGIQAETGAEINIEDDGTVRIYAIKKESLDRALEMVNNITAEIELDKIYQGKVVSTTNFGAFMEVLPGQDGMIHISELADFRVDQVEDIVSVGDVIYAKCIGIDDKGRVKMSRQAALAERGEQHIDDALREKASAKRTERSSKGGNDDWSPSDGDKRNKRRNNRR
jgi:polyribonucleotide nucleotidyltransferase